MRKLGKKEIKRLEKEGRLRDLVEIWVDRHNHKLELLRTFTSLIAAVCSSIVLLKLLHLF
jgi:predicted RNA-binding protein